MIVRVRLLAPLIDRRRHPQINGLQDGLGLLRCGGLKHSQPAIAQVFRNAETDDHVLVSEEDSLRVLFCIRHAVLKLLSPAAQFFNRRLNRWFQILPHIGEIGP